MNKENHPRILGSGASIDWSKPGITVELLKIVENRVGVKFQFDRAPWKRCLYMVENGLADATFHASYKAARAEFGVYPAKNEGLDPTRVIYKNAYVFYALKGSGVLWDGKALSHVSHPVGTQLSFAVADDLRKMGYEVAEEGSVTTNLDKLAAGRISAYADLESIVDSTLSKNKSTYSMIEKLHPPMKEKTYYLLISKTFAKAHPELTERIWDAIRDVQQTDAYREMVKKYTY
jgi:polar amino acid transport system substrate-binding protein